MKIIINENQLKTILKDLVSEDLGINNDTGVFNPLLDLVASRRQVSNKDTEVNSPVSDKNDNGGVQFAKRITPGAQLMHPLGRRRQITSTFGGRRTNIQGASTNHKGIDISTPSGSPVYAPADGIVEFAGDTTPNGCGGFVKLNHGNLQTKFCHLSKWTVGEGQKVRKGQVIAYSGGGPRDPYRGTASGPHLHYEILDSGGIAMNPTSVQSNLA